MKLYHFWLNSVSCSGNIKSCVKQQSDIQKYLILSSIASAILITQLLQVTSAKLCFAAEHSTILCVLGVPTVMSWFHLMSGHVRTSVPCPGWACDHQVSAKRDSGDGVTESSSAQFPSPFSWACFVALIGLRKLRWGFRSIFTLFLFPAQRAV